MRQTLLLPTSRTAIMIVLWCSANVRIGAAFGSLSRLNKNSLRRSASPTTTFSSWQPRSTSLNQGHSALLSTKTETAALYGIDWVRDAVVGSLNDLFDPKKLRKAMRSPNLTNPRKRRRKRRAKTKTPNQRQKNLPCPRRK